MTPPPRSADLPEEDRRRTGRGNALHRLMVDHARWVGLSLLASVTLLASALVRGVFAAPGKIEVLTVKVDGLIKDYAGVKEEVRNVGTATWTFVALDCLKMDDSTFISTKLPCGTAFEKSGVTRRLQR